MYTGPNWADRINSYALVAYLPEPLASFVDGLRAELEETAPVPHAHLTILPPRPLETAPELAWIQVQAQVADMAPIRVGLDGIEAFAVTSVIYLAVKEGFHDLERLHERLDCAGVAFVEPFAFVPHVTLAQTFEPEDLPAKVALAERRWRAYGGQREFVVDCCTFVQNTLQNQWLDLAGLHLRPVVGPAPPKGCR